mmetsp:Transcript_24870/g.68571  ORF Transcript_24870/g.68571 Transcript_24870/m.68571 type:complete len:284 (+) Transcript_24870:135-986(+)
MIQKSSGCGDNDLRSSPQLGNLSVHVLRSSNDQDRCDFCELRQSRNHTHTLGGKLTRGCQDESLGPPRGSVHESFEDGQQKGSSLSATGYSTSANVSLRESDGNHRSLNFGWFHVSHGNNTTKQRTRKGELREGFDLFRCIVFPGFVVEELCSLCGLLPCLFVVIFVFLLLVVIFFTNTGFENIFFHAIVICIIYFVFFFIVRIVVVTAIAVFVAIVLFTFIISGRSIIGSSFIRLLIGFRYVFVVFFGFLNYLLFRILFLFQDLPLGSNNGGEIHSFRRFEA